MNSSHDIDAAIRTALQTEHDESGAELAELRGRINSIILESGKMNIRSRRRRLWIAAAAVAVVILVPAGIAIGAVVHRAFTKSDPITDKIGQLQNPAALRATGEDYRVLTDFAAQYNVEHPDDSTNPSQGVFPTVYSLSWMACSSPADVTGVRHQFSWVADDDGHNEHNFLVAGLATDDVSKIEVELADGARAHIPVTNNVFAWTSKSDNPVGLHWWINSAEKSVQLTTRPHDPVSETAAESP